VLSEIRSEILVAVLPFLYLQRWSSTGRDTHAVLRPEEKEEAAASRESPGDISGRTVQWPEAHQIVYFDLSKLSWVQLLMIIFRISIFLADL